MSKTERNILDDMVSEILGKVAFNPETNDLTSLYDMLSKELPRY